MLKTYRILVIGFNLAFAVLGLSGCGQTGPLYLPQPAPAKAKVSMLELNTTGTGATVADIARP